MGGVGRLARWWWGWWCLAGGGVALRWKKNLLLILLFLFSDGPGVLGGLLGLPPPPPRPPSPRSLSVASPGAAGGAGGCRPFGGSLFFAPVARRPAVGAPLGGGSLCSPPPGFVKLFSSAILSWVCSSFVFNGL